MFGRRSDRLKFIGCEIIYREACKLAAESPCRVDLEFLQKALHDLERQDMLSKLQSAVDAVPVDAGYRAILLGYARCSDGVVGLQARSIPLVIPKAHDCISFFFGGRKGYQEYFDAHPGTYFHTTGWLERGDPELQGKQGVMAKLGLDMSYQEMVEKYGKENADFIIETVTGGLKHYCRICYLRMGVMDECPFIEDSRLHAQEQGWEFDLREGDLSLLRRLIQGDWNSDDFLVVAPGQVVAARNDGDVLGIEASTNPERSS